MTGRPSFSTFSSLLALGFALGCGGSYRASEPEPAVRDSVTQVVTGTCRDYDLGEGTLDLVTGVSFALRTATFVVHDDTEIILGDRRASLADLRANLVLRVEYRVTPRGNLADRITQVLDARGLRSP